MQRIAAALTIPCCLGWILAAGPGLPAGEQFQVNTYTTGFQSDPAVAIDGDGNLIVVWESIPHPNDPNLVSSIVGQRYDSLGALIGGEFQISTATTGFQALPAVSAGAGASFAVVWQSYGSDATDTSSYSVQGRVYDPAGDPVGGQFLINTFTSDTQRRPAVAGDGGQFLVVWNSAGSSGTDGSSLSIQGQRIDGTGTFQGGEFQVNAYTTGAQEKPAVAGNNGLFLVVWESSDSGGDASGESVQGQLFDSLGMALGGEFQVNADTTGDQRRPAVAASSNGDFLSVWDSSASGGDDSDQLSVQGRLFDSGGTALTGDFQVNAYTTDRQYQPSVSADGAGNFVVVWESGGSSGTDGDSYSVQGQRYDDAGSTLGDEFQLNTYTTSSQRQAAVAAGAGSDFTVAWHSFGSPGSDTSSFSIQARRFGNPLEISTSGLFNDEDMDGLGDAGETISYSLMVTNTAIAELSFAGSATLTNVSVDDTAVASVSCPSGNPIPSLAASATEICTGTHTLTQDDVDAGLVDDTATADSDQTAAVEATGSVPLPQSASFGLLKNGVLDLGGDGVANPGDFIAYTFEMTNSGNVTMTSIAVTDPLVAPISCPSGNPIPTLAPAASESCTGSYALTQADVDAGTRMNSATASGQAPGGAPIVDNDSHVEPIPQTPAIELIKSGTFVDENGNDVAEVGETIAYSFAVKNAGNVTLFEINVSDALVPAISCPSGQPVPVLAPAATETCTGTYAVTQADLDLGCRLNAATAAGQDPSAGPVMDSDSHSVVLNPVFADGFESGDTSGW